MKYLLPLIATYLCLSVAGCSPGPITADSANVESVKKTQLAAGPPPTETTASAEAPAAAATPVAAGNGVPLTPENTQIEFVGLHVGDEPNPRKGGFKAFSGTATLSDGRLAVIDVQIDTTSLYTEIDKLTDHLKSPDFFDVRQHPQATFKSTVIEHDNAGGVKITGDLTLLGKTQSITFPATVSAASGLSLKAEFKIDRTQFGMNFGLDNVEKEVAMTVTVGG